MPLNIKNPEVERLAAEVARLAGETKTEAIRQALLDRKARLQAAIGRPGKKAQLLDFLERSVWPKVPRKALGKPLSRQRKMPFSATARKVSEQWCSTLRRSSPFI